VTTAAVTANKELASSPFMSEAQAKKPAKSGELIRANKRKAKLRRRAKSDTLHGYNLEAQTARTPQKTTAFAPSAVKNFGLEAQ